jgi:hypothetical protein
MSCSDDYESHQSVIGTAGACIAPLESCSKPPHPSPIIPTNSDGASATAGTCRIKGSVPMTTRRAACNCGKLEIVCEGEPVRISMCHCLECQRRTGAVFGGQAWFTQQQTTISRATQPNSLANLTPAVQCHFGFCPICGSTVYWEAEAFPATSLWPWGHLLIPPSRHPRTLAGKRNGITGLSRFALWLSTIQIETLPLIDLLLVNIEVTDPPLPSRGRRFDSHLDGDFWFWHIASFLCGAEFGPYRV